MNTAQMLKVKSIYDRADAQKANTVGTFNKLKKELAALGLKPDELARAVRKIGEKLGV